MIETKTFRGQSTVLVPALTKMVWTFGGEGQDPVTTSFILAPDGTIEGYSHPNEVFWRIENHVLLILKENGELMWHSINVTKNQNDLLTIIFATPEDSHTRFILQQNPAASSQEKKHVNAAPQPTVPVTPSETGISDADYLFPTELEVSPSQIKKILMIGPSFTALCLEQFQLISPEIKFDYISCQSAINLPPTPPSCIEDYDFQYIQLPLRSILTDRVVWGERFNKVGFANRILKEAISTLNLMLAEALAYNKQHNILTFVCNFIVPQMSSASSLHGRGSIIDIATIVQHLNEHLVTEITKYKNAYLLNIDSVASTMGKRFILDDVIYFYSHNSIASQNANDDGIAHENEAFLPLETYYPIKYDAFTRTMFRQAVATYRSIKQIDSVQVVIFDLDNTLWRGQITEHYSSKDHPYPSTEGWPLGLWETIHYLRARGILVALCSNNEYNHVKERWADIINPPFLALDDFISVKINFSSILTNITEISKDLGVPFKNIVFVSNNPTIRESVTSAFSEIRVIGGNPYLIRRILLWAPETQPPEITKDIHDREYQIRRTIS